MKRAIQSGLLSLVLSAFGVSSLSAQYVTQNFESGSAAIEVGNYWSFKNILFDKSTNYAISGEWVGKNTRISASNEDTWVVTPWVTLNPGNITFAIKLDRTKNDPREYAIFAIPYDKTKTNGEGAPIQLTAVTLTAEENNTILRESFEVPANLVGELYKIRFSFTGMGSGSKTSVDDFSIPGIYSSDPSNDGLPLEKPTDTDGDGVADKDDAYPNDKNRAFNNYYPGEGVFGTLAFEDNWPTKGDYDFNDVVIDYNTNTVTNGQNQVVEIKATYKLIASGALFHNGFGFQLDDISSNKVTEFTISEDCKNSIIVNDANGLEHGQTYATAILFDDFFNLMPGSDSNVGINTVKGASVVPYKTLYCTTTFIKDGTLPSGGATLLSELSPSNFNYFIIKAKQRGIEIHLADRKPTSLVNATYFGTQDDRSNGVNFYKTANNLPWGIDIPQGFRYPTEHTPINEAYPNLLKWVESNGVDYTDWYTTASAILSKLY